MAKKFLFLFVFFGFTDAILISCCKDSLLDYTKFNSLSVVNSSLKDSVKDSATLSQNGYRIKLALNGEFVASKINYGFFMDGSYANSCENMGLNGLKSDITKFEMTCNKAILGVAAGGAISLNDVKAYEFGFFDDVKNKRLTINEWLNILNNGRYEQSHYNLYLEFTKPIVSSEYLKFKILIGFQDGLILQAETDNVRIL